MDPPNPSNLPQTMRRRGRGCGGAGKSGLRGCSTGKNGSIMKKNPRAWSGPPERPGRRKETLCQQRKPDFCPISAGAFVATHAFSDRLAPGRPDEQDLADIRQLADRTADKIRNGTDGRTVISVDGDAAAPYYIPKGMDGKPAKFLKARPKTREDRCVQCGICARNCPMGAISLENPSVPTGTCIKCQRCIRYCPHEAKYFDDPAFLSHVRMLETQYTAKKANVMYW